MKKLANFAVAASLFFAAMNPAQANRFDIGDTSLPAIEQYRAHTKLSIYMCRMVFKLSNLVAKNGTQNDVSEENIDYIGCIRDAKLKASTLLGSTLKSTKKAPAKEALKTYHVAFIGTLEAILPAHDEILMLYNQRSSIADTKMTDAWARFEVEQ